MKTKVTSDRKVLKQILRRRGLDALQEEIHQAAKELLAEAVSPAEAKRWRQAVMNTDLDGTWLSENGREVPCRIIPASASA